jgi:threonine/homoserine/homoserine lactone efflux protein
MGLTPAMIAAHTGAAVLLGLSIAVVEHLYTVCATLLTWLRLFTISSPRPTSPPVRWAEPVVIRPVLLRPGLGMRAPPSGILPTA